MTTACNPCTYNNKFARVTSHALLTHGTAKVTSTEALDESFYHLEFYSPFLTLDVKDGFFRRLLTCFSILFLKGEDLRGTVRITLNRDQATNLNDALIEAVYHPDGEYVGEQYNRL